MSRRPTKQGKSRVVPKKRPNAAVVELIGDDGLTGKQRVFVEEYLICLNATEAARRAKYKGNAVTLASVGYENLRKPQIATLIQKRLAELGLTADEVLARLSDQACSSMDDFVNANGQIDLRKARTAGKLHLLKAYSQTNGGTRVEVYDAQAALALLGRHHGLFAETSKSLNVDVAKLTTEQLERIANGEDPIRVIADSSAGGTGTAQAASDDTPNGVGLADAGTDKTSST